MLQKQRPRKISDISEEFLTWLQVERRFAKSSIISYRSRIKCFIRDVGDIELDEFTMEHIFRLKQILHQRENTEVFIGVCLAVIKGLLKYYREHYSAPLKINPDSITIPKRPRREVVFLTSDEIKRFRESIDIKTLYGLRFRTLVEVLLGSGMRISEALSLDRTSIDFQTKECLVIGKGSKQRPIFFSEDAIYWVKKYLERRTDKNEALFVTSGKNPKRLTNQDNTRYFKRQRIIAGINKKVTPHCLRHCLKETHNKVRRSEDSWRGLMQNISILQKIGIQICAVTTLHKMNYHELPRLASFLDFAEIDSWQLQLAMPSGRMKKQASLLVEEEDFKKICREVLSLRNLYPRLNIQSADCFGLAPENSIRSNCWTGCTAGISSMAIDACGNIMPCLSLQNGQECGNFQKKTISEIWENSTEFDFNRNFKINNVKGRCEKCNFLSECRGGCNSQSFSYYGCFHNSPFCFTRSFYQ